MARELGLQPESDRIQHSGFEHVVFSVSRDTQREQIRAAFTLADYSHEAAKAKIAPRSELEVAAAGEYAARIDAQPRRHDRIADVYTIASVFQAGKLLIKQSGSLPDRVRRRGLARNQFGEPVKAVLGQNGPAVACGSGNATSYRQIALDASDVQPPGVAWLAGGVPGLSVVARC